MLSARLDADPTMEVMDARNLAGTVLIALTTSSPSRADLAEWDDVLFAARLRATQDAARYALETAWLHLEAVRTTRLIAVA